MDNLDYIAAKTSQTILDQCVWNEKGKTNASEVENLITKALGVLQEDGVYAVILYLQSRKDKDKINIVEELIKQTIIINITPQYKPDKPLENCQFVSDNICNNLNHIFLIKELWEKTLIYCRYGAKAYDKDS